MGDNNSPQLRRRQLLKTVGASAAVGAVGLSAFTGTVAAWEGHSVEFKGCSDVWLIVSPPDIKHDPSAVVRIVVATSDSAVLCRDVEITEENTTTIPDQYGFSPVRKITVDDDEKVLGVIFYNYNQEERFSSPSCIMTNENQCAMTESTPSIEDAVCMQNARENGGYDCEGLAKRRGSGQSDEEDSNDEKEDDGSRGLYHT